MAGSAVSMGWWPWAAGCLQTFALSVSAQKDDRGLPSTYFSMLESVVEE